MRHGGEGLYLLLPDDYVGGVAYRGSDARWLYVYRARYGIQNRDGTVADAVALARRLGVRRYVV